MILFFAPGGRLGNLMFQIAFIESIRKPKERVFCTLLLDSKKWFRGLTRYYNSNNKWLVRFVDRVLSVFLMKALLPLRLIGIYQEKESGVDFQKGRLSIAWVRGYFQDPNLVLKTKNAVLPRMAYFKRPRVLVGAAAPGKRIFVHVRRTDYLEYFLTDGRTPVLPYSYYEQALSRFGPLEDYHVFVVGDDQAWSRAHFSWLPHKTFSEYGPLEDMALMSLCHGGVVSNSSFAWWGAQLSVGGEAVVAPLYWIGWNLGRWHPRRIFTSRFKYIPVDHP